MDMILREAIGWLSVLVSLGAAAFCATRLGRVPWAGALLAGFALQALVSAFFRVVTLFAGHGLSSLGPSLALASLLGIAGQVTIVAGVVGLLSLPGPRLPHRDEGAEVRGVDPA
jgi:hypothetical protein